MRINELINEVSADPMKRLRFAVLREFGVLPCSAEAEKMSDRDCIEYAALLALEKTVLFAQNPSFDGEAFRKRREAEK